MIEYEEPILVELTPTELASTLLALYHEILERCLWALDKGSWFRKRPIGEVQEVVNSIVTAFLKVRNLLDAYPHLDRELLKVTDITDEQWQILDSITTADSWGDIPLGKA